MRSPNAGRAGLVAGALVLVLASTAAGATAVTFRINVSNTASALTTLTGTLSGRLLQLTNNSTGSTANTLGVLGKSGTSAAAIVQNSGGGPALDLRVNAGRAPFKVNSATKVANLNADRLDGLDQSAFARRAQEAWRNVGAGGQPPFKLCNYAYDSNQYWTNSAYLEGNPVGFYKDATGRVHLRGQAQCWYGYTDATIFTLPAGYRPAFDEFHPTFVDRFIPNGMIVIEPDGDVVVKHPAADASHGLNWISVDGISFRAER